MESVTGIGGIFIRSKDPKSMAAWYKSHLGIDFGDGTYVSFKVNNPRHQTVFSFFKADSKYFDPSTSSFMINFTVKDLPQLLKSLESKGVTIVGEMQEGDYGKFAWVMDPEGNKIELWEAAEEEEGK
jgi:predicted enzyme related to lactoylglutathione lyase